MDQDKVLYNDFLNGNKEAFDSLINKYRNYVIFFISRYVKHIEIAEDIFQDVILHLLENQSAYNNSYSFKSYIYTIAKSKALNYIKKNHIHETDISKCENISSETLLEDIVFSNERKAKIQRVLNKLKTDYQIENLVYNAKKSLKKLLIKERIVEMKNHKFIRLLSIILVVAIVVSGAVFATKIIIQKISNANLTATFTGSLGNADKNHVWVGTFNLAWNELLDFLNIDKIEFEENTPEIANELNKKTFTKDFLSEKDYYIISGTVNDKLKGKIESDIYNKFNEKSNINWNVTEDHYLIYSMLKKTFSFKVPFPERASSSFAGSSNKVKYFGLDDSSIETTFDNVEALFYNSNNDFAVKINTEEGEELYLYRTNDKKSFAELYNDLISKSDSYTGRKNVKQGMDRLKIPFIQVHSDINYDELCHKYIKGTNAIILQAIQTVDFELNNYGGFVRSEGYIDMYMDLSDRDEREFNFTDTFVLFMKEKGKEKPYFALLVDNDDVLVKDKN